MAKELENIGVSVRVRLLQRGKVPEHLAVIAALLAELRLSGVLAMPAFARLGLNKKKPRGTATIGRFAEDKQATRELRS